MLNEERLTLAVSEREHPYNNMKTNLYYQENQFGIILISMGNRNKKLYYSGAYRRGEL